MEFAVTMFPADYAMDIPELARESEARGFESLWFPEHTHMPVATELNSTGTGPLADEYRRTLDQWVALAAAAAVTSKIKLGSGICLVTQRDPILLAKEVASVDHLSKGRVIFGIGAGWNRPEIENHGVPYARRWRMMRERIAAMKAIWANDVAEYHGDLVDFGPINSWPKPVQKPHPEIIVGGDGPRAVDHMVEYGDGWLPHPTGGGASLEDRIKAANEKLAAAGRTPVPITVFGATGGDAETAFHLLRQMGGRGAPAWAEIAGVAQRLGEAVTAGDYRIGIAGFVDYWNGPGAWNALPPERQNALIRWTPKGPLDFHALFHEATPLYAYRALKFPVLILRGERAPAPTRVIAEGPSKQLPDSRLTVVRGAGHMGPLTHASEVAARIAEHIRAAGPRSSPATTSSGRPMRALSA